MAKYTVYKVTNTINGNIYIGVHKTDNPNDRYLGSGLAVREAVAKHGRDAFTKEVLHAFDTLEEAYAKERQLVDEEFVARRDTYNMICGGAVTVEWTEQRRMRTPDTVARQLATRRANGNMQSYWKGKAQSPEANAKRSASHAALERIACPHCDKLVEPGNAKRWHFDNCATITGRQRKSTALTCPHCDKTTQDGFAYMKKYHFDQCGQRIVP